MAAICAAFVLVACACATASAIAPTAGVVTRWCLLAWRAQAKAPRRASARGTTATDNRRMLTHNLAQLTPLTAARSDALDRA
eukprot:1624913-Pleurochrysis_carterae.AAC.1